MLCCGIRAGLFGGGGGGGGVSFKFFVVVCL